MGVKIICDCLLHKRLICEIVVSFKGAVGQNERAARQKEGEMNETQTFAMRAMCHDGNSVCKRSMTAKDMAMTSHRLSRSGDMATTADGSVWIWNTRTDMWAMWKAA